MPRPPAEIQKNGTIIARTGENVTDEFKRGAQIALRLCVQHQIQYALLKARSPSCGNEEIYNGRFTGEVVSGAGITARLLQEHGIQVFNESQIDELAEIIP